MTGVLYFLGLAALTVASPVEGRAKKPKSFLKELGNSTWVLGNEIWNVTQNRQYANKLYFKGADRVGKAVGHYVSYNGAASDLNWTSAAIVDSGSDWINVKFTAKEGDFHWVIYDQLPGAYQYFVNHALPTLGEFRTLWRLDNASFPRGHNNVKDGILPPLADYLTATNVQDETWQKADGTFLTKYDWSAFVRQQTYYGVYGDDVGSWYLNPGKDYYNGDHLKQELMVHRESKTGDAVQLNMIHGTHYQAVSRDSFPDGKTWGPWLWYLNDGSKEDAAARWDMEEAAWPYKWFQDKAYQSRGKIQGKLVLSDGRPAAGAAVFLGDNGNTTVSTLDQGTNYYYTTYADEEGKFDIHDVRTGTYGLYAWGAAGPLSDVTTSFTMGDISIREGKNTNLKTMKWNVSDVSKRIFQIGAFDRTTDGFYLTGNSGGGGGGGGGGDGDNSSSSSDSNSYPPFEHARIAKCPANLTYTVSSSSPTATKNWCFGQSAQGIWTILFPTPSNSTFLSLSSSSSSSAAAAKTAKLTLSLAGFSQGTSALVLLNGKQIGNITSASLVNSQDTYRGATRAGEWRLLEFDVDAALLRGRVGRGGASPSPSLSSGSNSSTHHNDNSGDDGDSGSNLNSLAIQVTKSTQWRGWLWDSVVMEWV